MRLNMTLRIENVDDSLVSFTLESEENSNGFLWRKINSELNDYEYRLTIQTDKDLKEIISIEIGEKIIDDRISIESQFKDNLLELKFERETDEADGIEHEHEQLELISPNKEITKPYDPKLIRVEPKNFSVFQVYRMIEYNEIDLSPDFQRNFVWTDITRKSRLIESLLLRIPLPVFYLSQSNEGLYQVVDGVQRLTVLKSYINNEFRLKNLEYLEECEGKYFNNHNLPSDKSLQPSYIRRIEDSMLFFNIIDPQTPDNVRYEIFKRINTGGKALNKQEIRNCLCSPKVRNLLRGLATSEEFIKATRGSVNPSRMADQELVLRFIAFYLIDNQLTDREVYRGNMDDLLDETISTLNETPLSFDLLEMDFLKAMENAYILFGYNAFRKSNFINKSLFLSLSRVLYKYDFIIDDYITQKATDLIRNEINSNYKYNSSLSLGTNDASNIKIAYETAERIIRSCLE